MDMVGYLKNVGAVLGTVTTLVYASGYLALRVRAFTLGTDPAFSLVYEGYVFAGFRFVLITLIILLVSSPLVAAIRWGAIWLQARVPGAFLGIGQWLLLVLLALCTLYITFKVLSVNGVLLQSADGGSNSWIKEAVMGSQVAVMLMFVVVLLTALTTLWLRARLPAGNDMFTWVLIVVAALQLFLVPITYGALYADRKVRVLAAIPDAAKVLREPLGIVDRASNSVTLLGLDKNNERRLVTIKVDDLNGIPVKKIVSLKTFAQNELVHAEREGELQMSANTVNNNMASAATYDPGKGFFKRLVDSLQMVFENIGSLGETVVESGQIWMVKLDPSGKPARPERISAAANLAWPVFDCKNGSVYAIQQDRIVRLSGDGQSLTQVDDQNQWLKLFGVAENGDILGLVLGQQEGVPAILHANGTISLIAATNSEETAGLSSLLEQENRVYAGGRSLSVERSSRGGRGFDVFFKEGEQVANVSDCGDDRCGQPSLSPDFRTVLYVRKSRY